MSLTQKYLNNYMIDAGYTQVEKDDGQLYDLSDCTTSELAGALGWDVVNGLAGLANFTVNHPITAVGYFKGFEINEEYADEVKEDLLALGFSATPSNVIQSGPVDALKQANTAFKKFLYDTDNLITNGIMSSGGGGHKFSVPRETVDRAKKIGQWVKEGKISWKYRSGGITIDTTDRTAVTSALNALIAPDTITIGDDCWNAIQGQQNIQLLKISGEGGRFYAIVVTRTPVYRYTATNNYVYHSTSYGDFTRGCRVYMYDEDDNPIGTVSSPSPKNKIWVDVDSGNYSNTASNHSDGGHNFTINHGYDSTNDSNNIPYWLVSANIGIRSAITEVPPGTQYVWVSAGGDTYDYVPLAQNSARYGRLCGVWTQPQTRTYTVLIPASESPNGHDICSVSAWHNGTAVMSVETNPDVTAVLLNNSTGSQTIVGKVADPVTNIYNTYNIVTPGTRYINVTSPTLDPELKFDPNINFNLTPENYYQLVQDLNNNDDGVVNNISNITNNWVYPVDTNPDSQEPVIGEPTQTLSDVVGIVTDIRDVEGVTTPVDDEPDLLLDNIGITIYDINEENVHKLWGWLWDVNNTVLDKVKRLWTGNPIECVVSFAACPFRAPEFNDDFPLGTPISFGGESVMVNGVAVVGHRISPWVQTISLGSIYIEPYYKSFLDYDPYTKIRAYLPMVGLVDLNTDDVMGRTISLEYRVDFLSGTVLARIWVSDGSMNAVFYQYSGSCYIQIPLTSRDFSAFYKSALNGAIGMASGQNGASAITIGLSTLASYPKEQISRSGSLQGNSGAISGMTPYVIITRPISTYTGDTASLFSEINGQTAFGYTFVGNITSGYVEFESITLDTVHCTNEEKDEILELMTSGFYMRDSEEEW